MRDSRTVRRRRRIALFNSENSENSGRPMQTMFIFCSRHTPAMPPPGEFDAPADLAAELRGEVQVVDQVTLRASGMRSAASRSPCT